MFPYIVLLFCDVTALYQRVWGAFGFNDLACHNKLSWKQWWKHVMKAVNFAKFAFFFRRGGEMIDLWSWYHRHQCPLLQWFSAVQSGLWSVARPLPSPPPPVFGHLPYSDGMGSQVELLDCRNGESQEVFCHALELIEGVWKCQLTSSKHYHKQQRTLR